MKPSGLTTTKSPFIEKAQRDKHLFIHQPYELYSKENHKTWEQLFQLLTPKWKKLACVRFLEGVHILKLEHAKIPSLEAINLELNRLTGFQAKAVSGYVPAPVFFDCLSKRLFPTTITIRDQKSLHYLPEPDIFHDIAGHVPMHTDPIFADLLQKFGQLTHLVKKQQANTETVMSNQCALARFFWFTIEFGLIKENNNLRVFGSGLLSSAKEIEHALFSPKVQRLPFNLKQVINQSFQTDSFQPILFFIDSFDHLLEEVDALETALLAGRLDSVNEGKLSIDLNEIWEKPLP